MPASQVTLRLRTKSRAIEQRVQHHVFPIFGVAGTHREALGSGFLLRLQQATILVTAAHVLRHVESFELHTLGQTQIIPIEGRPYVSSQTPAATQDLDIGFVVLNLDEMREVPSARPLSPSDCDVADIPAGQTGYGFAGIPIAKNSPLHANNVRSYYYGGLPAAEDLYQRLALSPATHFAMKFNRKYMLNEAGQDAAVPKPQGMSGGPVFKLGTFTQIEQGTAQPRVIAFGIEWHKEHNVLLGVRIAVALNAIAQLLPAYANELPEPVHFRGKATPIERV